MRRSIAVIGAALVIASATIGGAGEVNCKKVMKDLQAGRTADDIETTSAGLISAADVKKCQEDAAKQGGDQKAGDQKGGGTAGGTTK
jgi:hypothetical protein